MIRKFDAELHKKVLYNKIKIRRSFMYRVKRKIKGFLTRSGIWIQENVNDFLTRSGILRWYDLLILEKRNRYTKIKKAEMLVYIIGLVLLALISYFFYVTSISVFHRYSKVGQIYIIIIGAIESSVIIENLSFKYKCFKYLNKLMNLILFVIFTIILLLSTLLMDGSKKMSMDLLLENFHNIILGTSVGVLVPLLSFKFSLKIIEIVVNKLENSFGILKLLISDQSVIYLLVFLVLIFINFICIIIIKFIFNIENREIKKKHKEKYNSTIKKLLEQFKVLKLVLLLLLTFGLKVIDYQYAIDKYEKQITLCNNELELSDLNSSGREEITGTIITLRSNIDELKNDKIISDGLFYSASLFTLVSKASSAIGKAKSNE